MLDFTSKKPTPNLYVVAITVRSEMYLYPVLSLNHAEALQQAVTYHRNEGRPLPVGTTCLVEGSCSENACNCGGRLRTIGYAVLPMTSSDSVTAAA